MTKQMLEMSDEDFLKMNAPSSSPSGEEVVSESVTEEESPSIIGSETDSGEEVNEPEEKEESEQEVEEEDSPESESHVDDLDDEGNPSSKTPVEEPESSAQKEELDTPAKSPDSKDEKEEGNSADKVQAELTADDYKAFYEQVTAPFKANGKTIQLSDPAEAIQLMQMGANFTRKMQAIAPHRKTLLMLENNGLLDEDKLSYLIDLDKKNPEAIKKLVKEAGIDPLDIDTNEELKYQQGNHKVSEEHVRFVSTLEDLESSPEGVATLQAINSWDNASKQEIGKYPDVMTTIHTHRQLGWYDAIANEVERQRILGNIASNVSFLQAYTDVGNRLSQSGALKDPAQQSAQPTQPQQTAQQQQGVRRVASPKPSVSNSDKAKAASTSRATGKKAAPPKMNPLAMSDDDFLKQMENRV